MFLLDETGIYFLPSIHTTYQPKGVRWELRVKLTKEHLSTIGGVTPMGELGIWTKKGAINEYDIVDFLSHLLIRFNERLFIIWDGSTIHSKSIFVRSFIKAIGSERLRVENFPGYAPELNPTEGLWHQLKGVEMKNICATDLTDLKSKIVTAIARVRRNRKLIQGFFGQTGLII
ncbi:MAG: transposase [Oligoflexia bacterium]|nr:transposase [Oligoflexia bacterium]